MTVKDLHISSPCRKAKVAATELFRSCSQRGRKRLPLRIQQDAVVLSCLLGPPGAAQDLDMFTGFSSYRLDMRQQQ